MAGIRVIASRHQPITTGGAGATYNTPDVFTLDDNTKNFTGLGVTTNDWLYVVDGALGSYEHRRKVSAVSPSGDTTRIKYTHPMVSIPPINIAPNSSYSVRRITREFIWNIKSVTQTAPTVSYSTDVHTSELAAGTLATFTGNKAEYRLYALAREDVFLFTIQSGQPTVVIEDADGVVLDNVTISGAADVSEQYPNMARMVHRTGGPEVGNPSPQGLALMPQRITNPLLGRAFFTPVGKVETVRMSNVRSNTFAKYGSNPPAGMPFNDRYLNGDVNRRK